MNAPRVRARRRLAAVMLALAALGGCNDSGADPMETVPYVDLERFMGAWFVLANIPTFVEKDAYNPVERYELNPDGTIATTFTFNKGGFDGPLKVYRPKGFVLDKDTNARWGMQFIWPIKSDFRVIYLDEDYRLTVIGREQRDYVWVMGRTPDFSDADFARMQEFIASVGYDPSKLQRAPHQSR